MIILVALFIAVVLVAAHFLCTEKKGADYKWSREGD